MSIVFLFILHVFFYYCILTCCVHWCNIELANKIGLAMKYINIRINKECHEALKKVKKLEGQSYSSIITNALNFRYKGLKNASK